MFEALFWLSGGLVAYVYAGYPALLGVWARVAGRRGARAAVRTSGGAGQLPGVSLIIAARNEARRLPARLDNLLQSDYPADRLQIIVASDGSSDDTMNALEPYAGRIDLLMLPPRGKANALNAAVMRARHPILVFADARQRFAPDAIRRLASHFADPRIGAVSGELILDCEHDRETADLKVGLYNGDGYDDDGYDDARDGGDVRTVVEAGRVEAGRVEAGLQTGLRSRPAGPHPASTIGDGVGAYWKYEKWIRRHEAIVGSTPGVTGAIYAMRRWLWQPLPADTILDDVLAPMRVVLRGFRVVFDGQARAYDVTAPDASAELRRKVRTLAGNYQLLRYEPRLLVPRVNPIWLQFMSHKVARLLVPYALAALAVTGAALCRTAVVYAVAFAAQAAFYGLAVYGALLDRRARVTPAPAPEVFREAA